MDDDRDLIERLRRYESRVPVERGRSVPSGGGVRWVALAGVATAFVALAVIGWSLLPREIAAPVESPSPTLAPPSVPATTTPPSATTSPPATTPQPTPTPTTTPEVTGFAVEWSALEWPGDVGVGDVMYDETTRQWIAAAGDSIWISPDGATWTERSLESAGCEQPENPCSWGASAIARAGDRLVALGGIADLGSDGRRLVSWVSGDGTSWTLASRDDGILRQALATAESGGMVLLATPDLTGPEGGTAFNTSRDGTAWETSVSEDGLKIHAAYGDADGFVVTGDRLAFADPGYDSQPIVLVSDDGHAWRSATVGLPNSVRLRGIGRLPSGRYVAAGFAEDGRIVTWASNGNDEPWSVAYLGTAYDHGYRFGSLTLASGPDGIILSAYAGTGSIVATTVDGERWRTMDVPGDPATNAFVALEIAGDTAIAFSLAQDPQNGFAPARPAQAWRGIVTAIRE